MATWGPRESSSNMADPTPSVDTFLENYEKDIVNGTLVSNEGDSDTIVLQHTLALSGGVYQVDLFHPDLNTNTGNASSPDPVLDDSIKPSIYYYSGGSWIQVQVSFDADSATNKIGSNSILQFVKANPRATTPTYFPTIKANGDASWANTRIKVSYYTCGDDIWATDINKLQNALAATEAIALDPLNKIADGSIPWSKIDPDTVSLPSGVEVVLASGVFQDLRADSHLDVGGGYGSSGLTIDASGNLNTDGYISTDDDLHVGGNATIDGTLEVTGDITAGIIRADQIILSTPEAPTSGLTVIASYQIAPSGNSTAVDVTFPGAGSDAIDIIPSGFGLQNYYNHTYTMPSDSSQLYPDPVTPTGDTYTGMQHVNMKRTVSNLTIHTGFIPILGNNPSATQEKSEVYKIWYQNPTTATWEDDPTPVFSYTVPPQVFTQACPVIYDMNNFILNTHIGKAILAFLGDIKDWTNWDNTTNIITTKPTGPSGPDEYQPIQDYLDRVAAAIVGGRFMFRIIGSGTKFSGAGTTYEFNTWYQIKEPTLRTSLERLLVQTAEQWTIGIRYSTATQAIYTTGTGNRSAVAYTEGLKPSEKTYLVSARWNNLTGNGFNLPSAEDYTRFAIGAGVGAITGAWDTRVADNLAKYPSAFTIGTMDWYRHKLQRDVVRQNNAFVTYDVHRIDPGSALRSTQNLPWSQGWNSQVLSTNVIPNTDHFVLGVAQPTLPNPLDITQNATLRDSDGSAITKTIAGRSVTQVAAMGYLWYGVNWMALGF